MLAYPATINWRGDGCDAEQGGIKNFPEPEFRALTVTKLWESKRWFEI